MFQGELVAIYLAGYKQAALRSVPEARAVAGLGLEGDRYFLQQGSYSQNRGPDREVTLIEIEAIEALARDYGITLEPGQARRNLVTRGVPLNHLVGREFAVGEVTLRGLRLCEPCEHLESLTAKSVKKALAHRGGLRAQVMKQGVLRAGDLIRPTETPA